MSIQTLKLSHHDYDKTVVHLTQDPIKNSNHEAGLTYDDMLAEIKSSFSQVVTGINANQKANKFGNALESFIHMMGTKIEAKKIQQITEVQSKETGEKVNQKEEIDGLVLQGRPLIEWMFRERRDDFHNIIKMLIQLAKQSPTNGLAFFKKFDAALQKTDLCDTTALFAFDLNIKSKMYATIDKLDTYADKIENAWFCAGDAAEKSEYLHLFASGTIEEQVNGKKSLRTLLNDFVKYDTQKDAHEFYIKLKRLDFKLDFVKRLHNEGNKEYMREHRHWFMDVVLDVCIAMFTLGIANAIQFLRTRNSVAPRATFFKHTNSEMMLLDIADATNYVSGPHIDMSHPAKVEKAEQAPAMKV